MAGASLQEPPSSVGTSLYYSSGMEGRMSDMIPNLEDLRAQLPTDGTAQDALEFISELAVATTPAAVDEKVDALVDRWLEVPVDTGH